MSKSLRHRKPSSSPYVNFRTTCAWQYATLCNPETGDMDLLYASEHKNYTKLTWCVDGTETTTGEAHVAAKAVAQALRLWDGFTKADFVRFGVALFCESNDNFSLSLGEITRAWRETQDYADGRDPYNVGSPF